MIILVVTCPVLESPSNGVVTSCGNEYQLVCNLTCDSGHIVSAGDLSRECLSTGFWTGEPLKCNGKAVLVDFSNELDLQFTKNLVNLFSHLPILEY